MCDSSAKRARILRVATDLLIEHGFEGTTYPMLVEHSRAAVGSINHFYGDKLQLAAAVYEEVAAPLVAQCGMALNGQGRDVAAPIRALQGAYIDWAKRFPHYPRLLRELEAALSHASEPRIEFVEERLKKLLGTWAVPLIDAKVIPRLSPTQLGAVVLAPAIFAMENAPSGPASGAIEWSGLLARLAISALEPQATDSQAERGSKRSGASSTTSPAGKQGSLFA